MLNFRGFRLMANPPNQVLVIRENGDRVDLLYSGTHTIQAAPFLGGPWTTVHSSTAPFTDQASETNNLRFYRMRDEPGPTYSVNAVGYYRLNLCAGFTMIANQLNAPGGNAMTNVFKAPPNGTFLYKFRGGTGGYESMEFIEGLGWWGDDMGLSLNPGEGAFIYAPSAFTHTFFGDVALLASVPIPAGYSVLSSPVPQSASLTDDPAGLGFPARAGDFWFAYPACGRAPGYDVFEYIADVGWNPSAPVPKVGESFFFYRSAASGVWTRSFNVGP
jgi:hypothetical protein